MALFPALEKNADLVWLGLNRMINSVIVHLADLGSFPLTDLLVYHVALTRNLTVSNLSVSLVAQGSSLIMELNANPAAKELNHLLETTPLNASHVLKELSLQEGNYVALVLSDSFPAAIMSLA